MVAAYKNNGKERRREENGYGGEGAKGWSCTEVREWMVAEGFDKYAEELCFKHKVDGSVLLSLSEDDLREKPLAIPCLGDIKRLHAAITRLRQSQDLTAAAKSLPVTIPNGGTINTQDDHPVQVSHHSTSTSTSTKGALHNAVHTDTVMAHPLSGDQAVVEAVSTFETHSYHIMTRDELIRTVESPDTASKSLLKLAISFSYCSFSLLITSFVMVLVHDRTPDMKMYPPLPDIVLDNLPLIPWAFEMCEAIGLVLSIIWFCILLFHKHRVVIARRMFSLVGTVFFLRCVTMLITSLSVPGVHLQCRSRNISSTWEKMVEAYHIWSRLGMSMQGVRSCGDYMFSGHTTVITMLNHFITEYTPSSWSLLHTTTWCLNLFGVFFILAGHEHYSIDVFVAFYISSRMFLYYHTFAYNHANLTLTDERMRLWFPLGWFFEAGSIGRVPDEFELPIPVWKKSTEKKEEVPMREEKKEKEKKKKRN